MIMSEKEAANIIGQSSKENNELQEQRDCLLEAAEEAKKILKIMHDEGNINSVVCNGDVKKTLIKLEKITAKTKGNAEKKGTTK